MRFDFQHATAWTLALDKPEVAHAPLVRSTPAPLIQNTEIQQNKGSEKTKKNKGSGQNARLPQIVEATAAARLLGMEPGERGYAPCPLPGHGGVAYLEAGDDGEQLLWCDCLGAEMKWQSFRPAHWYPLSDAYWSVRSGRTLRRGDKLEGGYRLAWRLLALEGAGVVVPEPVPLPLLPATASEHAQAVRRLFTLLCGVRLALRGSLAVPAVPVVLAVKLVQDWCGILSPTTANEAIRELKAAGVIVQDGYRRPFRYWPGEPQDSRSESNDRGMRPRSSLPSSH